MQFQTPIDVCCSEDARLLLEKKAREGEVMKRIAVAVCTVAMMLCLVGCGAAQSSPSQALQDVQMPGFQAKVPADWTVNTGSYNDDAHGHFQYVSPDESQATVFYYEQLQGTPMTVDELRQIDEQDAIETFAATDYSSTEMGQYDIGGMTVIGYKCNDGGEAERMDMTKAYIVTDETIYTIETIGDKSTFDSVMESIQLQ